MKKLLVVLTLGLLMSCTLEFDLNKYSGVYEYVEETETGKRVIGLSISTWFCNNTVLDYDYSNNLADRQLYVLSTSDFKKYTHDTVKMSIIKLSGDTLIVSYNDRELEFLKK